MMICDWRPWDEEGLLFCEVSIMCSWHLALCAAVYYLLMPIHEVYCPVATARKHTLLKWEGNTSVQPRSCEAVGPWNCECGRSTGTLTTEKKKVNLALKLERKAVGLKSNYSKWVPHSVDLNDYMLNQLSKPVGLVSWAIIKTLLSITP